MNPRLLLVEDDREISELLVSLLEREHFNVDTAFDGKTGLDKAKSQPYDLLILDIMLPQMDGLEVLRVFRKTHNTPVLMLTARGDDVDRIVGFEMGADDYLPKPFNPRELIVRIKAILRRVSLDTQPSQLDVLEEDDLSLHLHTYQVYVNRQLIDLTSTEFSILKTLLIHKGQVIEKGLLTEKVLGRKQGLYDRAIDMHVSNLRKKLGPDKNGKNRILTIRSVGYLLPDGSQQEEHHV
jgi:two-component system response regulator CpxR